ncbi:MAG: transposase [Thermoplasmatales archaeon]
MPKYNEALVRRDELNLDPSVLEGWKEELKLNDGKVGEPYHYAGSYIRFLAFVRLLFRMPYRQTEGFVRFLSRHVEGLKVPNYSTLDRRRAVIEQQMYSPKALNNIHRFGWRVEGVFSCIKRIFGEYVSAKFVNMAREMVSHEGIDLQQVHRDGVASRPDGHAPPSGANLCP